MSLILDALNRSRSDAAPVPGLGTQHVLESHGNDGRRQWLPWIGLGLALLIIAWIVAVVPGRSFLRRVAMLSLHCFSCLLAP